MEKKDFFHELKEKHWPKAKKELEKGIDNAKKMLSAGEKHVRQFSEKGVEKTRKITLQVKKERLIYDLGKALSATAKNRWSTNKKIQGLQKEIKELEKKIKKIK
jgi:predicted  nucleic acid-binding Zn-ribbon protein